MASLSTYVMIYNWEHEEVEQRWSQAEGPAFALMQKGAWRKAGGRCGGSLRKGDKCPELRSDISLGLCQTTKLLWTML